MKISLLERALERIGCDKSGEAVLDALTNDQAAHPTMGTEFVDAAGTLAVRLRTSKPSAMPDDPDKPWF